jgi:hypothetical protein
MTSIDLEGRVRAYLDAFHAREMDNCLGRFSDTAVIHFHNSTFNGLDAIVEWHRERFDADLRMERLEGVSIAGDTVTLEGSATSKRLRAWKLDSVSGTLEVRFKDDLIQELRFGMKLGLW